MRRLSPQSVILDILVTHVVAIRAQNGKDGKSENGWIGKEKLSRFSLPPSLVGRCLHPRFALSLQQTQFRAPYCYCYLLDSKYQPTAD
jgi:hypothetical protein